MKIFWRFWAFMCGLITIAGINAFFRDFSTDMSKAVPNLVLGLICAPLAVLCIRKGFGTKKQPSPKLHTKVPTPTVKRETPPSPNTPKATGRRPTRPAIQPDSKNRFDVPDEDIGKVTGSDISYLDAKALKFWDGKPTNYEIPSYYAESAFGKNVGPALHRLLRSGYLETSGIEDRIMQKTVPELKQILSKNNLKVSGNKSDLVRRLTENLPYADLEKLFPVSIYHITEKGRQSLIPYTIIFESNSHNLSFSTYRLLKERERFPALSNEKILAKLLLEDIQIYLKSGDQFRYQELVLETGRYFEEIGRIEESLEYRILAYFMYHRQILEFNLPQDTETHPYLAMAIDRCGQQCGYTFNQLLAYFETTLRKHNPFGLCTSANINKTISFFKKSLSV